MAIYETIVAVSIAFVAGVGTAIVNKWVINNPLISRKINKYCCCGKCDNVSQPVTRRNTN